MAATRLQKLALSHEHTKAWSDKIASFDAYVFVTPEYNHSTSGVPKDTVDHLFREWNNKAPGFVNHAEHMGGARAVEHFRLIMAVVLVATLRAQVLLSLFTGFENFKTFSPVLIVRRNYTQCSTR